MREGKREGRIREWKARESRKEDQKGENKCQKDKRHSERSDGQEAEIGDKRQI